MGLFDTGFDLGDLANYLNPMGTAQAAPAPGVPPGMPTEDQLLNSAAAVKARGIGAPPAPVPQALPAALNTTGRPEDIPTPPPNNIVNMTPPVPPPLPITPNLPVAAPVAAAAAPALGLGTSSAGLPPDVGGALTGNAAPSTGSSGATDISGQAKSKEIQNTLANALKGVSAPKGPVLQKISSPSVARPTGQIKSGELAALLAALNAGGGSIERKLPTILGK